MKLKRASFPNGALTQDASFSVQRWWGKRTAPNEQSERQKKSLRKMSIFRFLVNTHLQKKNPLLYVLPMWRKRLHRKMSLFIIWRLWFVQYCFNGFQFCWEHVSVMIGLSLWILKSGKTKEDTQDKRLVNFRGFQRKWAVKDESFMKMSTEAPCTRFNKARKKLFLGRLNVPVPDFYTRYVCMWKLFFTTVYSHWCHCLIEPVELVTGEVSIFLARSLVWILNRY